jgi:branched-chain amino acid transport system substrate-binding protein
MRLHPAAIAALYAATMGCDSERHYRIGVVLDRAGTEGALLATARINRRGGVDGHRIELRSMGNRSAATAQAARTTAEELASDETVLGVVGHTNSNSSLVASVVYNAHSLAQIAPTTTTPMYGEAGPFSFRLVPSDAHQGVYLADVALARTPRPRIAVLFVNNDYGRPLNGAVITRLREGGTSAVFDTPYTRVDSLGGVEIAGSLRRMHVEVLIWLGRSTDFLPVARALRGASSGLVVLASDAFSRGALAVDTLHSFDGVRFVRLVDMNRPDSVLQRLRVATRNAGRGEISDQTVLAYDAVTILAEAIRAVGPHRVAIRDWLVRLGSGAPAFEGLSGPIAFGVKGERTSQYFMEEVGGRAASGP